jgi:hypothetical protein
LPKEKNQLLLTETLFIYDSLNYINKDIGLLTTNQLEIMVKEEVVDKSDALA